MELRREGRSYSSDTVKELRHEYPDAELVMIMGTDMLLSFEQWHEWEYILSECSLAVLPREEGDIAGISREAERLRSRNGARIYVLDVAPLPMSSSGMREMLVNRRGADELDGGVYTRIIKTRDDGAKPQLDWLRERAYKSSDRAGGTSANTRPSNSLNALGNRSTGRDAPVEIKGGNSGWISPKLSIKAVWSAKPQSVRCAL